MIPWALLTATFSVGVFAVAAMLGYLLPVIIFYLLCSVVLTALLIVEIEYDN